MPDTFLRSLRSRIECDPRQPSANMELIHPGSQTGPTDEGALSSNGYRERLNNFDAIPDSRGRGEVAFLCVIGGLTVVNCVWV